jgi:hypothetical protein
MHACLRLRTLSGIPHPSVGLTRLGQTLVLEERPTTLCPVEIAPHTSVGHVPAATHASRMPLRATLHAVETNIPFSARHTLPVRSPSPLSAVCV